MVVELIDKLLSKFRLSNHSQRVCHLNLYIVHCFVAQF